MGKAKFSVSCPELRFSEAWEIPIDARGFPHRLLDDLKHAFEFYTMRVEWHEMKQEKDRRERLGLESGNASQQPGAVSDSPRARYSPGSLGDSEERVQKRQGGLNGKEQPGSTSTEATQGRPTAMEAYAELEIEAQEAEDEAASEATQAWTCKHIAKAAEPCSLCEPEAFKRMQENG
jgi:hypothetical protein